MIRDPSALIDLAALRHNLGVCRKHAPSSRIWAVIKADGYGHGMSQVASALRDADGLAVARVDEAIGLCALGIDKPLLVLEGAIDEDELDAALERGVELVVHDPRQAELLEKRLGGDTRTQAPKSRALRLWVKVDTGMGRLGLLPEQVSDVIHRLSALAPAAELAGLMTHLANADDPSHPSTANQCGQASALARRFGLAASIANSAGVFAHPGARSDWIRPGIMLYGGSPLLGQSAEELGLRPVMTLTSRLIAVRALERGATVGYGSTYRCPEAMSVGVVAIGYGDGYPRHAPTGTPVLVRGRRASVIGRVSMDMISIDLRGVPDAHAGDAVVLWGDELPVEQVSEHAGTINYELLCRVSPRVRRVYSGAGP